METMLKEIGEKRNSKNKIKLLCHISDVNEPCSKTKLLIRRERRNVIDEVTHLVDSDDHHLS